MNQPLHRPAETKPSPAIHVIPADEPLPRYVEFPITRAWGIAQLATGKRPTLLIAVDNGMDVPVRLIAVPKQGPATIKFRSGIEADVPVSALRRVVYTHEDKTPSSTGYTDRWDEPEGSR